MRPRSVVAIGLALTLAGLVAPAVAQDQDGYRHGRLRYVDPGLAHLLEEIPYASSGTVSLAYRRSDVRHPLDGFGFVVPHVERRPIIACTFSSVKYAGRAPEGHVLLRVFMGGALNEAVLEGDDATLVQTARDEIGPLLGIAAGVAMPRLGLTLSQDPPNHGDR